MRLTNARMGWSLLFSLALWMIPARPLAVYADDLEATALSVAPQDAAFFVTSLNMREAWTEFLNGRFVARLRAVPFINQLEMEFQTQWDNPNGQLGQAKDMLDNPNVRNILKLGQDMLSDEMFVYGGSDWCETIEGLMEFQSEIVDRMSQGPDAMQTFFENLTREDFNRIHVPTTVFGFRIDDDENARLQLDALQGFIQLAGMSSQELKPFLERLKRSDLSDGQTLSITLDSGLIPLDALNGDDRQFAEKIVELLGDRQLSLAIGVKSNRLLLAFGEGDSTIDHVGEAGEKLLEHEVISTLREANTDRLRSISYVSQRWAESQWKANFGKYFQNLASQLVIAIESEATNVPDLTEWRDKIQKDAVWLDSKLNELVPAIGPILSWSRAIDGGAEGYSYNWSKNVILENGSPISVLEHAGQMPLLMIGFKQSDLSIVDDMLSFVIEHGQDHLERFVSLAERDETDRESALKVVEKGWPLFAASYRIFHEKICPALAENETLIAVSAGWTLDELPNLPPPSRPLPMPEVGLACALENRELFLEGCRDLYDLFDRVVDLIREIDPSAVPADYSVPRPEEEQLGRASRYSYSQLTQAVPLPGFMPQVVVAPNVLVVGYSDRQVKDMLQARELETRPAWMEPSTPTAVVTYADFAGMFRAVRPWVEFALMMTGQDLDKPLSPAPGPVPTGNDVLQIFDCFTSAGQSASTTRLVEDGPTVTRWVWVGE